MAITTMDGLVAALAASPKVNCIIPSVTNVAGGFVSLNQAAGNSLGTMATPTAFGSGGTKFQNNTTPLTGFPAWTANAGGGALTYVGRMAMAAAQIGAVYVYDLLWACSGFNSTTLTAQTVSGFAGMPSRNSTGAGAELWAWGFGATGATAQTISVSYTNQSGTSGHTSVSTTAIASWPVARMLNLPLQAGDTGLQSIASLTFSASSGTAGNIGLAIMQRVAALPCLVANVPIVQDFAALGLPAITDEATLLFVNNSSTTSSGIVTGTISLAQG
jgi:hypothetical protein